MITPPRSSTRPKLPGSSPSSARLRKIAPSPVKIPPPLYLSPSLQRENFRPVPSFSEGAESRFASEYPSVQERKYSDPFTYDQPLESRPPLSTTLANAHTPTNKRSRRHGGEFMMRHPDPTATTPRNDASVVLDFCSPSSAEQQQRHDRAGLVVLARAEDAREQHEHGPESEGKSGRREERSFADHRLPDVPVSIRCHLAPSSSSNTLWFDHPTPKCGSIIISPAAPPTAEAGRAADARAALAPPGAVDPGAQRVVLIPHEGQADRNGYQNPTKPHESEETLLQSDLYESGRPSLGFKQQSRSHSLLPSLDPNSTALAFGSSTGSSSQLARMDRLAPIRDAREVSVAESFHTFGRPDRRPSAVSIEDEDGWSYSLSAYGGDDEDRTMSFGPRKSSGDSSDPLRKYSEDSSGPSRKSSADTASSRDSLTSFGIPDFVHFIPPPPMGQYGRDNGSESTMELQTPRTDGSYSKLPSSTSQTTCRSNSPQSTTDRSELFTPNYTVATLPRPSMSSSGHSDSSTPRQYLYDSVDPKRPLLSVNTATDYVYDEPSPRTRSSTLKALTDAPLPSKPTPRPSPPISVPSSSTLLAPEPNPELSSSKRSIDRRSLASSTGSDQITPPHIAEALKSIDKSTTLTLIVDQEGAREVQTTLKYMKIHKPQFWREKELRALEEATLWCETPSRPEPFQTTGCIEFGMDPKARAKWTFHHAALEGLPVLRRVTVQEEDSHDYISRSATLQIRDSGVYAVHGTEDKGRVEWKFEYLVQPRFSAHTGEAITGEKIIIPLGFYVSPSFFNPDRATKLHLLSVFKKQLTPNIVSEKVKPPHIGTPPKQDQMTYPLTPTSSHVSSSSGGGFSRAFSKVKSTRSAATTPTESQPFGTRNANRPSSRGRNPTSSGYTTLDDEDAPKENRTLRRRATSLFGKSRPFTPPANITDTHPVPRLQPMKSLSSLTCRRPHTAQATIRGEAPMPPPFNRHETFPPAPPAAPGPSRPKRPATANARIPPVAKTTYTPSSHPFSTHVKPLPALPNETTTPSSTLATRSHGRQRPATAQTAQYPVTPRSSRRPSTAVSSSNSTPAHARLVTPNHQIVAGQAIMISPDERVSSRHGYAWRSGSDESVTPMGGKSLPLAPRRVMGRPSTAQARLGTAI